MICKRCGAQMKKGEYTCPKCGVRYVVRPKRNDVTNESVGNPKPSPHATHTHKAPVGHKSNIYEKNRVSRSPDAHVSSSRVAADKHQSKPIHKSTLHQQNKTTHKRSKKKNRATILIIPVIIVLMAIIIAMNMIPKKVPEWTETVDNYFAAHKNSDPKLMYSSVMAKYWINYMNEAYYDSCAYEVIEKEIAQTLHEWGCGDVVDVNYTINGSTKADKDQLEKLEDNIYDWYAYYLCKRKNFELDSAYNLDITFTVTGQDNTETFRFKKGLLVIEEDGKWRIPGGNIECDFYKNEAEETILIAE